MAFPRTHMTPRAILGCMALLAAIGLPAVAGTKYVATSAEWALFDCQTSSSRYAPATRFDISEPTYFQYEWERQTPTNGIARARADLDGDGVIDVTFELPVTCTAGRCTHEYEPKEIRPE